jgi:hypothetical protein
MVHRPSPADSVRISRHSSPTVKHGARYLGSPVGPGVRAEVCVLTELPPSVRRLTCSITDWLNVLLEL